MKTCEASTVQKERTAPLQPRKILFVCTGNTCRSPMAQAVANHLANELRFALPDAMKDCFSPSLVALSAGLSPNVGEPIAKHAVSALESAGIEPTEGLDYHAHTAIPFTEELARSCDLLVGMTPHHALEIVLRFPQAASKITSMPKPIPDPYGGDETAYRECLAEITLGVKKLLFNQGGHS